MVELGMTRSKNAMNILMKNVMDFACGSIAFFLIGFGLMFGTNPSGYIGTNGFALTGYMMLEDGTPNYWTFTFWLFQAVFAATAATIVSGAMAERTKYSSYLIYSVIISAIIYPIFGSWAWGGLFEGSGWLEGLGFIDYAGSTVVHSVGAWAALAGAIVLGPRIGKYTSDGKPKPIPGHNMPLAGLGVLILWLGWYGFNPGSTTAVGGDMAVIAVTTTLAAAGGAVAAMIVSWVVFKFPDCGMTLNGALAGLVSITAPCYNVSPIMALVIGLIGGAIVVFSVLTIENMGIDDPVGAVSVHGVCGAWGTLAAGLFAQDAFGGTNGLFFGGEAKVVGVQLIGILACFVWTFGTSFIMFSIIKATIGLRVTEEEEMEGLDLGEHGGNAYPEFSKVIS
jgi:Amt family ammonium transporter